MLPLRVEAPAKINLFLDLIRRRPDGYHDLSTLFAEVDWCDCLRVDPADRFSLVVDGPHAGGVPCDGRNLVWRAWELLDAAIPGGLPPCRITLTKNLPHGAGLGGGSSDAAAALLALNQLAAKRGLAPNELDQLAAALGSDCVYFLRTGPALGTDRGIILKAVPLARSIPCLLVQPGFPISTREAYGRITPAMLGQRSDVGAWIGWMAEPVGPPPAGFNTFEQALHPLHPELATILDVLCSAGSLHARLSGSGSTCFGLFADEDSLQRAAEELHHRNAAWSTQPSLVLPHQKPNAAFLPRPRRLV